jgi:hypothetical protein
VTIAVSVKVDDGLVLAADSASIVASVGGPVENVYNNAHQVFNLRKGRMSRLSWDLATAVPV